MTMRIKMNKTTKVAMPKDDGPSGVEFLMKGEEYDVADDIAASLIRGGEAVRIVAPTPTAQARNIDVQTEEAPSKRGPKSKKDRGAAPENK